MEDELDVSNIFINILPNDHGLVPQGGLGKCGNGYFLGVNGFKSFVNI